MLANFRELGLHLHSDWLAGLEVVHDGPLTEDDVYFALMYSDLRESCIFPTDSPLRPEILQNSTKLSHGSFLLQVTSSEDISIPDAQRPRTTGTSETRMLKLSLNFGNGPSVTAVELERIPQIADCPDAGLKILILDEPNSGLDLVANNNFIKTIEEIKKNGCTILVVSHRTDFLFLIDKILVLSFGNTMSYGPKIEVLEKHRRTSNTALKV